MIERNRDRVSERESGIECDSVRVRVRKPLRTAKEPALVPFYFLSFHSDPFIPGPSMPKTRR